MKLGRMALAALLSATSPAALAQPARVQRPADLREVSFNIPSGDLAAALQRFARQSRAEVIFSGAELRGRRTSGVNGRYAPAEAIKRLVAGSDANVVRDGSGAYLVKVIQRPLDDSAGEQSQEAGIVEADVPNEEAQEIIVTGTRTRSTQFAPALPTSVVTREENERLGRTSVEEALRSEPAFTNVTSNPTPALLGQGAGFGSTASAQLRGLPTLTLLNGRRVASSGFITSQGSSENFVDLSSIPFGAIERVEILKGGGSALYGTDAVGGIVNYVLRRDFNGVEASMTAGATEEGDARLFRPSVVAGFSNDMFSVMGVVDYEDRSRVRAVDRRFSATGNFQSRGGAFRLAPIGLPQNVLRFDTFELVPGGTCDVLFDDGTPPDRTDGPPALCYTDLNKFVDLAPDRQRLSALFTASMKVGATEFFSELTYSRSEFSTSTLPVVDTTFQAFLAPGDPRNPFPAPILLPFGFAATTEANRLDGLNESFRLLGGVRSRIGPMEVESTVSYGRSSNEFSFRDAFSRTGVATLVESGRFNPVDPRRTPGVIDEARVEQSFEGKSSILIGDLIARGELFDLGGGPLSYAVGGEVREEKINSKPNEAWERGDIFGFASYPAVRGRRTNYAAYGEIVAPVTSGLTAQIALRYDKYQGVGETLNPQASLVYKAAKFLTLRGAYGTGFRAPSLSQLSFTSPSQQQGGFDPVRCPVTEDPLDCQGPFNVTFNSSGLRSEKTEQFNIGFDLRPVRGFRLKLDYWNITYKDQIDLLSTFTILGDEELERLRVVRGPTVGNLPGRIQLITTGFVNLSKVELDGLDGSIVWDKRIGPGNITVDFSGVYFLHYKNFSPFSQYDTPNVIGEFFGSGPRFRANLTATYRLNKWTGTAQITHIDSYFVAPGSRVVITQPLTFRERGDKINAFTTLDLSLAYSGIDNTTLVAGVRNVFDKDPPFDPDSQLGFDFRNHDPLGRSFFITARYKF